MFKRIQDQLGRWLLKDKHRISYTVEPDVAMAVRAVIGHETDTAPEIYKDNDEWIRRQILAQMKKMYPDTPLRELSLTLELVYSGKV